MTSKSPHPVFRPWPLSLLALGIGANATIFSWVNAVLVDPIPGTARANDLVEVTYVYRGEPLRSFSYPDYRDIRDGSTLLQGVAGHHDPEAFLADHKGRRVVLDEIHRLDHPSGLLKIAADRFPSVKIIATGSSTLGAPARFRDTLAGRKHEIWLTPMTLADLSDFGSANLRRRLLRGGLPPFWLSKAVPERDFQEWVDANWAKDVLELFRLERRRSTWPRSLLVWI